MGKSEPLLQEVRRGKHRFPLRKSPDIFLLPSAQYCTWTPCVFCGKSGNSLHVVAEVLYGSYRYFLFCSILFHVASIHVGFENKTVV